MGWIVVIVAVLWFLMGDPPKDIANVFWSESAAPWEQVDAFYYPDRMNLQIEHSALDIGTVEDCRDWVYYEAAVNNDTNITRGDYECGIGWLESFGGINVYRITVQ